MEPLLLQSFYLSPIWGGPRIAEARGIPWSDDDRHGEAFDVSVHPTTMGVVRNGPCAGRTLAEAIAAYRDEILGDVPDDAPLQVTFMDAAQTLSVQVHPDEAYAQATEGDHGKVEAWYIVSAEPDAAIIGGCTTSDVGILRRASADDTVGDLYGRHIPVREGDFVLIQPGTMHALGAGILAVEVSSLGNTTYRVCDWGRGRELHVDKAFDVLRAERRPLVAHFGAPNPQSEGSERLGVDAGCRAHMRKRIGRGDHARRGSAARTDGVVPRARIGRQLHRMWRRPHPAQYPHARGGMTCNASPSPEPRAILPAS